MANEDVAERFLKDVAEHEINIVSECGLTRHITFKKPDSFHYGFHIVTWPGYLAISGDAGCYVFARLPDMFQFFRGNGISPSYWGEKLEATDRHGGYEEFSKEMFHDAIKRDFEGWHFASDEDRAKAWSKLQDSDLAEDSEPESLNDAIGTAMAYKCPVSGQRFIDFWDHHLQDYTFRFLWCCHAIQWAVSKYDATKAPAAIALTNRVIDKAPQHPF